jgi:hypothetical protein
LRFSGRRFDPEDEQVLIAPQFHGMLELSNAVAGEILFAEPVDRSGTRPPCRAFPPTS